MSRLQAAYTAGYRNQSFAALLGVMGLVFGLGAVVYAVTGRASWPPMLAVVLLAAFVVGRLARAGAFVTPEGVTVVNPLKTVRVPREEVAGFAFKGATGAIELRDGSRVQVWGIQARNGSPGARRAPEAAIAALRERFEAARPD